MSLHIHSYIRAKLHDAFLKSFSNLAPLPTVPITFSSNTPDSSVDIATPFPIKISSRLDIPVFIVSEQLLKNFYFDNSYISNTTDDLFYRGYLNFRLSTAFIFRSVYETFQYNIPVTAKTSDDFTDIMNKIYLLLKRNVPENVPSFDQFSFLARKCADAEYRISRLIAVSDKDAVHSSGSHIYFQNRLLTEAHLFYKSCPIPVKDTELSLLRIIILKALFNRLQTFLFKSDSGTVRKVD